MVDKITKSLASTDRASATSVTFQQANQQVAAVARQEKIVVLGNYDSSKTGIESKVKLITSAEQAGKIYGFGSALHRMFIKLFPVNGNGSKVETYALPIAEASSGNKNLNRIAGSGISTVTPSCACPGSK